jgi:hypothetical protein
LRGAHARSLVFPRLEKDTRERDPLDWAESFGHQGIASILVADRTNDGAAAETAVRQIQAAYERERSGGDVQLAADFQARLTQAQAIRDRLKGQ